MSIGASLTCALAACASAPRGGPGHPQWQTVGDGPARDRLVVGGRYDPTGRVDGYFQGDRRISLDELLRLTGHAEEADRMRWRAIIRPTLMITGGAIVLGGLAYAFTGPTDCPHGAVEEVDACNNAHNWRRTRGGLIAGGGAIVASTGWLIGTGRPADTEVSHWAATYNRQRGIPPITHPPTTAIGVRATGASAQLVVAGSF